MSKIGDDFSERYYQNIGLTRGRWIEFSTKFRRDEEAKSKRKNATMHNTLEEIPEDLFSLLNSASSSGAEIKTAAIQGSFEEFSNDLRSLLIDASFSDVTIKSGTKYMKVHKGILSARSPVFKAMLSNSTRESVSIDDLDPDAFRDLISFIYCNQVQNLSVPTACHLMVAAEKYQLPSLKCICVDYLMSNLSTEHVFLILEKADLCDKKLKMQAMNLICEKISDLKGTKEWKNLQLHNPALACEVFNMLVENLTGNNS